MADSAGQNPSRPPLAVPTGVPPARPESTRLSAVPPPEGAPSPVRRPVPVAAAPRAALPAGAAAPAVVAVPRPAPGPARLPGAAPGEGPAGAPPETPARGPANAPGGAPPAKAPRQGPVSRPARPARMRARHWAVVWSFLLLVAAPAIAAGVYLYSFAADQYASRTGFTVRQENAQSALDMLGGLGSALGGASSSDTDILYEFIRSQEMVRAVDAELDLRSLYSRPEEDPVFRLKAGATIEDLTDYWQGMTRVFYDGSTGLIEVEARAFRPEDAQAVASVVLRKSGEVINELSAVAREDTLRYAREDLEQALEQLREARQALTRFRNETQMVDVGADLQGQMGVLASLQGSLAEALVELDLLMETSREDDPRVIQAQRRIDVIERRIEEERAKVGGGAAAGGTAYADLVGEFESLQVDLEFAQQSYLSARGAYEAAVAEARRQSRYLAAYVQPTLAEESQYPRRAQLLGLTTLFLAGTWTLLVLVAYSLRDRR